MAIQPTPNLNGKPKNVGLTIIENLNTWADRRLVRRDLENIARSNDATFSEVIGAVQALHASEYTDMADFEELCEDGMTLKKLRDLGVNTAAVKKLRVKTTSRTTHDGETIVETTKEVELHERATESFREIMDRTNGKAIQQMTVENVAPIQGIVIHFMGVPNATGTESGTELPGFVDAPVPLAIGGGNAGMCSGHDDPERSPDDHSGNVQT